MTFFTALRVQKLYGEKLRDWTDYSPKFMDYLVKAETSQHQYESYRFFSTITGDDLVCLRWPEITASEPWEHQLRAYSFAFPREAAMLDMDMGTGKTKVVFDLIANRRHRKTLVVAPPKILESGVWEEQATKHWPLEAGPLRMLNLYESDLTVAQRTELADEWLNPPYKDKNAFYLILMNYEAVWRSPFKEWAKEQLWDLVTLEESHRAKKAGGKASKALFEIGHRAKYRLAMSGTPMAHSPLDIYAQYRFLDSGIFGTNAHAFNMRYGVFGGFENRQIVDFQNQEELNRKYFQIAFHVDESVQSLPPTQDLFRYVKLDPATKKQYNRMKKEMVATFKGRQATAANSLVRTLRLQQITAGHITLDPEGEEDKGPITVIGHEKQEMLADILEDLDPDEPIVIFTLFRQDMIAVREVCRKLGRAFAEVSGSANEVKKWKRGKRTVLGVQIKTGAEGLDLTRARYAIYYSLTPSLAFYKQSRKRIHRPGQMRKTKFIHILADATVDREIMVALEERRDVIKHLLDTKYFEREDE